MADEIASEPSKAPAGSETPEEISSETSKDEQEKQAPKKDEGSAKLYRVKVDGSESEVEEDELIKSYQLSKTSYKRLEDASKLAKKAQPYVQVIEAMRQGDLSALEKLGVPEDALKDYAEKLLLRHIELAEMSPEQRELLKTRQERDKYKAEREREAQRLAEAQAAQAANKAAQEIESEIIDALNELNIPLKGNYRLVRRLAEDMFSGVEAGKRVTAKDAAKRQLEGLDRDFGEHLMRQYTRNPEAFIGSLPKEILDGIRKQDLKQVQSQLPIGKRIDTGFEQKRKPQDDKKWTEYRREQMKFRG